jgi:predicted Zn-dependent protease
MGVVLRKNREFDDALLNFKKALELRPGWAEVRLIVANRLAYLDRCPEAIKLINAAPAPHPSFNDLISRCQNR